MDGDIETVRQWIQRARHIVVFTGAGVSAESGIPTFRDRMTGLWENFNAHELATPDAFQRDPALVWGWYEWRRMIVMRSQPNPAHLAIAALAGRVPRLTVITQNVDDLHERAGSQNVIHLHGNIQKPRCFACGYPYLFEPGIPDEPEGGRRLEPPRCSHCGGYVRPGVVWFGESLPQQEWDAASKACGECDLMFVIGTSALVQPAAGLPRRALKRKIAVVQINPYPTALQASINLVGAAGELMPRIAEAPAGSGGEKALIYDQAVQLVLKNRKASVSLVQRELKIGYNRAVSLLEQMERAGLVSAMKPDGSRDILWPPEDEN